MSNGIKRSRTDSVHVQHYFDGHATVDNMAYFVKLCDEAGIPRNSKVTIHKNSSTLGDCGFTVQWFGSTELPEDFRPPADQP